jgi:hypothetical protein
MKALLRLVEQFEKADLQMWLLLHYVIAGGSQQVLTEMGMSCAVL